MMKKIFLYTAVCFAFACSDSNQQNVNDAISKTSDSIVSKLDKANDTLKGRFDSLESKIPKIKIETYKTVPISLQWIGFESKPGTAKLSKADNGWYDLKGEQINSDNEYLKIDGKVKRTDANHINFEGTIITYIKNNNGGKPCEKKGSQVFLKKDNRRYYRLQNMENCAGGNLIDYVDVFDLDNLL